MTLTDEQIRELCEKATAGPWSDYHDTFEPAVYTKLEDGCKGTIISRMFGLYEANTSNDAQFIAAARELVPQLLERAQRAEAQLVEQAELLSAAITGQETLQRALAEAQGRERAAVDGIAWELNQMMDEQLDKEEMYLGRNEKDMANYSHAKYMGLVDAKYMVQSGEWRGRQPKEVEQDE